MMTTRIPLLEKFGVCTVVMSYYGSTHRSFLLLSKLNSKSREMLDINYEGFLNSMIGNLFCIELDSSHINNLMIELPCDLFRYNIILSRESVLEIFLKIIENISSKTGHYFNEHFMHSRLCIDHITVETHLAKKLYLSLELLKKIEVIECKETDGHKTPNQRSLLIDCLSLIFDVLYYMRKPFPHFIGNCAEHTKLNPIYEFYKRIERLDMREFNLEQQVSYLTEAKDLEIIVNEVLLTPQNTEELETIINPEFYMKGINAMNFTFKKPLDLTNEFFNNISLIKPRLLSLNFFKDSIKNSDFIKILANIKHCDNLKLSKQSFLKTGFKLSFKNISILVKSNVLRPIYIECKNFTCELNANRFKGKYWFTKLKSIENHCKESKYLHINDLSIFTFNNLRVQEIEESKMLTKVFSTFHSICNEDIEFIIPMKYLNSVDINTKLASESINHEHESAFIEEIYNLSDFSILVNFSFFLKNIDQYTSILSEKCYYSFNYVNSFENILSKVPEDKLERIVDQLTNIRICGLFSSFTYLSSEELKLLEKIVSSPNSKVYLREVKLKLFSLKRAIEFLGLLSNCMNIMDVCILYIDSSSSEIINSEEAIKEAKVMFFKKVDIICNLSIRCDPNIQ